MDGKDNDDNWSAAKRRGLFHPGDDVFADFLFVALTAIPVDVSTETSSSNVVVATLWSPLGHEQLVDSEIIRKTTNLVVVILCSFGSSCCWCWSRFLKDFMRIVWCGWVTDVSGSDVEEMDIMASGFLDPRRWSSISLLPSLSSCSCWRWWRELMACFPCALVKM